MTFLPFRAIQSSRNDDIIRPGKHAYWSTDVRTQLDNFPPKYMLMAREPRLGFFFIILNPTE